MVWCHQAMSWPNVDQDLCHNLASLGCNKLTSLITLEAGHRARSLGEDRPAPTKETSGFLGSWPLLSRICSMAFVHVGTLCIMIWHNNHIGSTVVANSLPPIWDHYNSNHPHLLEVPQGNVYALLLSYRSLGLCPANERQCYFVTRSLMGWVQA